MFRKLISNLPFNPSLVSEVSFYARRMRGEAAVRRTGLIFLTMALLVQVFAFVSPPESTRAESANDLIRGGFSTREQAVNYCRANTQGFADMLTYYGVSCEAVSRSDVKTLKSTDYNKKLRSMGRIPQGPTIARTGKPTNETTVKINGINYYMRNLWAWDGQSHSTYKMLSLKNKSGDTILIMFNCGNIVTIGSYTPPAPKPSPPVQLVAPEPQKDECPKIPGIQRTREECDVCPNVPGDQTDKDQCYPCPEAKQSSAMIACLKMQKSASNQTQNLPNADGTLARPNDIIVYTLTTKNEGNQAVKGFIMEENMSDVAEYADILDSGGGELNSQNVITWPKADIAANAALTRNVTIKIRDPISQTPMSASDPGSFDLVMTNVYYGSSVNIRLPSGTVKSTEFMVYSLPQTGPGISLAAGFAAATFASYFFARSKLIAKELEIVKVDVTSSGGF